MTGECTYNLKGMHSQKERALFQKYDSHFQEKTVFETIMTRCVKRDT